MIDLVVHDGLLACEMTDQIFAGPLPDRRDRHLDRREARSQVPAPVEVVEADHRQLPRHREAAAFGFQQDAIGDDVVAADHGGRAVFQVQQIARGLAGIVQRIGHLDMPLRALLDIVLGKCPPEARDAGAGAVVVALKRGHDADPPVTEFDDVQRRAMGGALIVGADTRVGAIGLVDPDIDEGHRIVRKQLAQRVVMAIAAQHQAVDAASDQAARLLQFGVEIVTAGGHEQHVADRREIFLQRRDAAREHGVVDGRNNRAQRARAARRQGARRGMRNVADGLDGLRDARAQFGPDHVGAVERARDRRDRHAGLRRHGADSVLGRSIG